MQNPNYLKYSILIAPNAYLFNAHSVEYNPEYSYKY